MTKYVFLKGGDKKHLLYLTPSQIFFPVSTAFVARLKNIRIRMCYLMFDCFIKNVHIITSYMSPKTQCSSSSTMPKSLENLLIIPPEKFRLDKQQYKSIYKIWRLFSYDLFFTHAPFISNITYTWDTNDFKNSYPNK